MSLSGIKAGKAFVVIEAVDATAKVLGRVRRNLISYGKEFEKMGRKLLTGSILAITPTFFSTKVFMDFDDAMRKVEARSKGTGKEMDNLRQQAKQLGRDTAFTASEVGNLMMLIAQKGFNRQQISQMTPHAMTLAQATVGIDETLGEASIKSAEIITGTLRAFKMEASETGKVADLMTAAVNNSNYTLEDLMTSMQYAGPVAADMNVSLRDTVATMGVMRNLNIDPSIVGTAFRNIINYMSSSKGRDEFNQRIKEATGNTIEFVDAAGNMKDLPSILFAIGQATKGMGNIERSEALGKLFGVRASVPVMAFKDSAAEFAKLVSAIDASAGLAQKTATVMESGIGGAWRLFTSDVEGVALAIGESLAPALINLQKDLGHAFESLTAYIAANPKFITNITLSTISTMAFGAALIATGISLKIFAALARVTAAVLVALGMTFRTIYSVLMIKRIAVLSVTAAMVTYKAVLLASRAVALSFIGIILAINGAITASVIAYRSMIIVIGFLNVAVRVLSSSMLFWQFVNTSLMVATILFTRALAALRAALTLANLWSLITAGSMAILNGTIAVLTTPISAIIVALGALGALLYINRATIFDFLQRSMEAATDSVQSLWNGMVGWFNEVGPKIMSLGKTLLKTFDGVSTALSLGDSKAAWDIGLLGLQASWDTFVDGLMYTWEEFSGFFIELWEGATTSVAKMLTGTIVDQMMDKDSFFNWLTGAKPMELIKIPEERLKEARMMQRDAALNPEKYTPKQLELIRGLQTSNFTKEDVKQRTRESLDEEMGNRLRDRQSKIAEDRLKREQDLATKQATLDSKLEEIKKRAAEERKGAEDNVAASIDDLTKKIQADAAALVQPGDTFMPHKANEGLIKGTMDEAKEVFELEMRDRGEGVKKAEDQRQAILNTLKSIENKFGANPLAMA